MTPHALATLFWLLALVAFLAHGWGLSGLGPIPGVAPDWAYRAGAAAGYPLAVAFACVAMALHAVGWKRGRADSA